MSARVLVYARPVARERALRLLPRGTVLEVAVSSWISAGGVRGTRAANHVDEPFEVVSPDGRYVAHVQRTEGRLRPKPRAWLVLDISQSTRRL